MISSENVASQVATSDDDFTETHYRHLLRAAKDSYYFATYKAIPWGTRFVLWRHDLDYSINRALVLAGIEAEEGVKATYFVNPCSEFYNSFEPGQAQLLKRILSLGHEVGLHFDAAIHDIRDEIQLHQTVAQQGRWLADAIGVRPAVFSFHNPNAALLQFDAEEYGGLINCYSRRFKEDVGYCSDSNGYWRFRRLSEVLADADAPCLQVLTHPGWWQAKPMSPRQRIFRSAYGRAQATMRRYDLLLEENGRVNHAGLHDELRFIKSALPERFELFDYLWNQGYLDSLFVELGRLCVPIIQNGSDRNSEHQHWVDVYEQLILRRGTPLHLELDEGCSYLARLLRQHITGATE